MSDSYIQNLFAERIGGVNYGKSNAIYKFEKIKRAKRAAKSAKPDTPLIDMGVGEPDEMAFPEVVEALYAAAKKPENRGYADNGGSDFKVAAAGIYEGRFRRRTRSRNGNIAFYRLKGRFEHFAKLFYQ